MISTLLLSLLLAAPQCQTFETTVYAGQSIAIGTVSVSNTTEQLIIDLDVPFPWFFGAYHIYAGTGSLPVNSGGSVAPGQFPFAHAFTGKTRSYTVVIDAPVVKLDKPKQPGLSVMHSVVANGVGHSTTPLAPRALAAAPI